MNSEDKLKSNLANLIKLFGSELRKSGGSLRMYSESLKILSKSTENYLSSKFTMNEILDKVSDELSNSDELYKEAIDCKFITTRSKRTFKYLLLGVLRDCKRIVESGGSDTEDNDELDKKIYTKSGVKSLSEDEFNNYVESSDCPVLPGMSIVSDKTGVFITTLILNID